MPDPDSEAVLVLAVHGRDAQIAVRELAEHGLEGEACADVDALCSRILLGAGAAVVSEELLEPESIGAIRRALSRQAPWSDFPVLVASRRRTQRGRRDSAEHLAPLGNVTLLDSPLRLRTLVQAVRSALRARRRQYDSRRAIERRDQFLAMLGHELRNPLSSIVLAGEDIEGEAGATSDSVSILRRQTTQLTRIVDDLLDVARISTGKLDIARERFDLAHALGHWVQAFRPRFEAAGVTLELTIADAAPVDGDAVRLEQAFGNLLANCLKYTPRGGATTVRLERDDGHVTVSVTDDGVGIAPEMLPQIFDQFVQVEGSLDRSQGGMGVGLTLVRTLIELHGGTVEAHSDGLAQGSRLVVRLPIATNDDDEVARSTEARGPSTRRTVALVEDNEDARVMMAMALERRGHEILQAEDGPSGVQLILAHRPEAAIVDIGLPGLDGYGVARAVREGLGDAIALIAASGYGQPEDRARAADAGFDLHLTKPASPDDIQAHLERLLSGSSAASRRDPG